MLKKLTPRLLFILGSVNVPSYATVNDDVSNDQRKCRNSSLKPSMPDDLVKTYPKRIIRALIERMNAVKDHELNDKKNIINKKFDSHVKDVTKAYNLVLDHGSKNRIGTSDALLDAHRKFIIATSDLFRCLPLHDENHPNYIYNSMDILKIFFDQGCTDIVIMSKIIDIYYVRHNFSYVSSDISEFTLLLKTFLISTQCIEEMHAEARKSDLYTQRTRFRKEKIAEEKN